MFEDKKLAENKKNYYWIFLKWYWLVTPVIYFAFILPEKAMSTGSLLMQGEDIFTLLFQFINMVMSGLMFASHPVEQSKTGHADIFLKMAAVQQFFVQNWFGLILTVITWYKLPYKVKEESIEEENKLYFQSKTILLIAGLGLVLSILSMIGNLS